MTTLPSIQGSNINRRDFLKLKSLLLVWITFLQSFGVNLFSEDSIKKIDYSLFDKLLDLPFSDVVMRELKLRVELQKKYNTDANGNIHSLDRFVKEITNYIVSCKDFNDFKLLNTIQDEQIDYTYMFQVTAKHNELNSMKYLQQKLIGHKNENMLHSALEYAVKSQSFDTTLHLMQQKIKLDSKSQQYLLGVLHNEEYEVFYKKISGNTKMMLPCYNKDRVLLKRKMAKKTFSFQGYYSFDGNLIYEYLHTVVHNSLVDLYAKYHIDEFDLSLDRKKVYITTYAKNYPINFIENFETSLYQNGFNSWSEDLIYLCDIESDLTARNFDHIKNKINKFIYNDELDTYDFINIEMM